MLIIRRRPHEAVLIGDSIEIRIVELTGGKVTLGIVAPVDVLILREEIRIARQQNLAASRAATRETVRALLQGISVTA